MSPRSTGQIISQTVENLLRLAVSEDRESVDLTVHQIYSKKLRELADLLHVSYPYMPRKLKAGTWDTRDIDRLATYFHMHPADFLPGENDDWAPEEETPRGKVRKTKASGKGDPEND